jgi:hypothetical protein
MPVNTGFYWSLGKTFNEIFNDSSSRSLSGTGTSRTCPLHGCETKSVLPRLQWPKPVFKDKRAITSEEHAAILQREQNTERRDFYELLWHTGASQSDGACLLAEDVNWDERTICFTRKKLKGRAGLGINRRFSVSARELRPS